MSLEPGAQLGPYEVVALIGRGGMGEVYRARDRRLNRDVALKILPAALSDHPTRRARFEREAQILSQLTHPNICTVYDVGQHADVTYIAMEFIQGESLAVRLRRGPATPTVAIRWAIQIAAALDAAHRRGIVHRDLKPANVMVSDDLIKLLDFGLARPGPHEEGGQASTPTDSTISLTAERTIIGTLHYMAPEQLEGRSVDARTDLFAFGTVFYEMLTAQKAFAGDSDASVIAAVLKSDPPLGPLEGTVPATLTHLISRVLAKRPDDRWQTARDLMNELQWMLEPDSRSVAATPGRAVARHSRVALAAVGLLALMAGLAVSPWLRRQPVAPLTPIHLSFTRPTGSILTNTGRSILTISPDGKTIVFNANNRLYARPLAAPEALPIAGTQGTGVTTPFFSPDGRWVAFSSIGTHELKKIAVDGGSAITICEKESGSGDFGASWTADNQILFATKRGVFRVAANGGVPQQLVAVEAGEVLYGPQMLPDADHLLLTKTVGMGPDRWNTAQVIAYSLSQRTRSVLVEGGSDARYVDTGHLLYASGTTVFAVGLDISPLRTVGKPVAVLPNVYRAVVPAVNTPSAAFAVAQNGNLAYIPNEEESSINVAIDLSGRITPLRDQGLRAVRVSPDGSRIMGYNGQALLMYSLVRHEAPRRLADTEGVETNALWTPDGTHVTLRSRLSDPRGIVSRAADAAESLDLLVPVDGVPVAWSEDGKTLFYLYDHRLWSWHRSEEPRPIASVDSPYASLSPDRRWIAFHARENGETVPYIQSLSNPALRFKIAPAGHAPLWSPDGQRLFYVTGETNSLMAIDVYTSPNVVFGEPVMLVSRIMHGLALEERWFDVTPDGKQLLAQIPDPRDSYSRRVEVILNWFTELKRKAPLTDSASGRERFSGLTVADNSDQ